MKVNNAAAPLSDLTVADAKITNLTVGNLLVENLTITSLADERIVSAAPLDGYALVPAVIARRVGNVVFVTVQVENTAGAIPGATILGTLSEPYRPAVFVTEIIPTSDPSSQTTIAVAPTGLVILGPMPATTANIQQPSALVYPAAV